MSKARYQIRSVEFREMRQAPQFLVELIEKAPLFLGERG